jgi:predicted DNA-binding transcriptional regulator AlpA
MDHVGGIELAMEVTGLAKPSIYGLIWRKEIPHYKKGKRLYFSKIELLNWIKSGRQKLRSEILNDFETEQVKAFRRRRYP